jgi:hypothetical protein
MRPSNKTIYLPNNTTLKASDKLMLPFEKHTNKAREADILPGLKQPLMSVNKMSEEGYTKVFHPGEQGITVHKPGKIKILTTNNTVLKGSNAKGLWSVTTNQSEQKETGNNAYSIPSTKGKIKFLHAVAGIPTKETWLKVIKAGNYLTWPGVTTTAVNIHFLESDKTTKGHMKKQRQNVISKRIQENTEQTNTNKPRLKKRHDVYGKPSTPRKQCILTKLDDSLQSQAAENI